MGRPTLEWADGKSHQDFDRQGDRAHQCFFESRSICQGIQIQDEREGPQETAQRLKRGGYGGRRPHLAESMPSLEAPRVHSHESSYFRDDALRRHESESAGE